MLRWKKVPNLELRHFESYWIKTFVLDGYHMAIQYSYTSWDKLLKKLYLFVDCLMLPKIV